MALPLRVHVNTKPRFVQLYSGRDALVNRVSVHISAYAVTRKAAVMKTDPGLLFAEFLV